jgi:hypothetical protein
VKRLIAPCAALLLLACAQSATAQVFGQFTGAVPVGVNNRLFGGYGLFAHHQAEGLAQLRLSFYPGVDFGFHGGLMHVTLSGHSRTAVELGGDVKSLVAKRSETFPVDLALGGAIGVSSAEDFNLMSVGPTVVASRALPLRGSAELTPYAGAALLYSRLDIAGFSTTDVSLPVRAGLEYRPNPDVRLVLELQLPLSDPVHTDPKLVLGANFPF